MSILVLILSVLLGYALAANVPRSSDCVGTIASLDDVAAAQECSTVNIEGFTVPAGEGFTLSLIDGATVNLQGDVLFGNMSWTGPLFTISGNDITFNGNGHRFDGGGPFYWDGLGSNGGITKPRPMLKIKMSGRFSDLYVVNSPAQTFSVSNPGPLVISSVTVDDSQGDYPNAQSNGLAAGHNTDGFDVSTTDLTIENRSVFYFPNSLVHIEADRNHSTVHNQDDCIAINEGSNIVFTNNVCTGGHGISIGSITSNRTVSGVVISNNHIANEQQAIRIKTDAVATNSSVSNITYSGNTATNLTKFGILIDQSYPSTLGVPGAGVKISNINFIEAESIISVASGADRVAVNCAVGGCLGTWDWSSLTVSGGKAGPINNFTGIEGFSQ